MINVDKRIYKKKLKYRELFTSLIGNSVWSYYIYRLRYFFVNSLFVVMNSIIQAYYLFYHLSGTNFFDILLCIVSMIIVSSVWWGILEIMRRDIRESIRDQNKSSISTILEKWLWYTSYYSIVIFFTVLILATTVFTARSSALLVFYVIILLMQTVFGLFVRTLHSSCYAIRRVYRPVFSILFPSILSMVILICGWNSHAAMVFMSAAFLSTSLALYYSLFYTHKMFGILKYPRFSMMNCMFPKIKWHKLKRFIQSGCTGLFLYGDSLLFIFLLKRLKIDIGHEIIFLIYILIPLVNLTCDWSKLYYVDFIKLARIGIKDLEQSYQKHIYLCSMLIACICWIFSFGILYLLQTPHYFFLLALIFLMARSFVSICQIIDFTQSRFIHIFITGLMPIVIICSCLMYNISNKLLITSVIITQILAAGYYLLERKYRFFDVSPSSDNDNFYSFIKELKYKNTGVYIYRLFNSKTMTKSHIDMVLIELRKLGFYAINHCHKHIICYTTERSQQLDPALIANITEGCCYQCDGPLLYSSGQQAITSILYGNYIFLPSNIDLVENFIKYFPDGFILSHSKISSLTSKYQSSYAEIFRCYLNFLHKPFIKKHYDNYYVATLFHDKKPDQVFVIPKKNSNFLLIKQFYNAIHHMNISYILII